MNVQFTKSPNVPRGMGLTHLSKNEKAIKELTGKGHGAELKKARRSGRSDSDSVLVVSLIA